MGVSLSIFFLPHFQSNHFPRSLKLTFIKFTEYLALLCWNPFIPNAPIKQYHLNALEWLLKRNVSPVFPQSPLFRHWMEATLDLLQYPTVPPGAVGGCEFGWPAKGKEQEMSCQYLLRGSKNVKVQRRQTSWLKQVQQWIDHSSLMLFLPVNLLNLDVKHSFACEFWPFWC